jgi:hypothetical protein
VDRGANGGLFGSDVRILNHTNRKVTITGIDNHQVGDLPICTGAGYGYTQHGPVIFIMHQYAFLGQGKTIHSSGQLESFKIIVDDRSRHVGGKQRIITPDGHYIPLTILQGLAYLQLRPPTDQELHDLPHVLLTSDQDWDPSTIDNEIHYTDQDWYSENEFIDPYGHHPFSIDGSYKYRVVTTLHQLIDQPIEQ